MTTLPDPDLRRLTFSIKMAGASTYIGFAIINDAPAQELLQSWLDQAIAPALHSQTIDLRTFPLNERVQIVPEISVVTHLVGLYLLPVTDQRIVLQNLNRAREYLGRAGGPIVIWLTPNQLATVAEYAADLWSWRGGIYDFVGHTIPQVHVLEAASPTRLLGLPPLDRYRNPYDFVPFERSPNSVAAPSQSLIQDLSGQISFVLEILTPLCVQHNPGERNRQGRYEFARLGSTPTLPATSLKGMLRSVHEIVTNSTMGLLKSGSRGWYRQRGPSAYLPGENPDRRTLSPDRLTSSEALFGMVGGKAENAVGYAGRVLLDDIGVPVDLRPQAIARPQGGQPKPEHESFYFDPAGKMLGRKLYFHQQDYQRVMQIYERDRNMPVVTVEAVPAGTKLSGKLRFFNLSEAELASLVYALVLEDGLAHKLGYGKPLGLGTVRIAISQLEVEAQAGTLPQRLFSYGAASLEDWSDRVPRLRDQARSAWLARPDGERSYGAFAVIAHWPPTENFIYPDFGFFRQERGVPTKTTLAAYQGRSTPHFTRDALLPELQATQSDWVTNQQEPPPPVVYLTGVLTSLPSGGKGVRCDDGIEYLADVSQLSKALKKLIKREDEDLRVSFEVRRRAMDGHPGKEQDYAANIQLAEEGV